MKTWLIESYDDARKAFKKLFYNSLEQMIFVEDEEDFVFANKDRRRTDIWRRRFNIPENIKTDVETLKYIDKEIGKILPFNSFPCVVTIPDVNFVNCCYVYSLDKNLELRNIYSDTENKTLREVKKMFDEYDTEGMFFNSGIYIPITYEDFRIIISKLSRFSFQKVGKSNRYNLEDGEFKMTINFKEKEIKNG